MCRAKRVMMSSTSPARRFFSISSLRAGSVVWTEMLIGEIRRSQMRWISRWDRLVRVR